MSTFDTNPEFIGIEEDVCDSVEIEAISEHFGYAIMQQESDVICLDDTSNYFTVPVQSWIIQTLLLHIKKLSGSGKSRPSLV